MRKLLSAPVKMALSEQDNLIYQQILKHATQISLNLMAIKVENRPEDFLGWCRELHLLVTEKLNYQLLEAEQLPVVNKVLTLLEKAISQNQLKLLRITPWPVFAEFINNNETELALEERSRLLNYLSGLKLTPLAEQTELDRLVFAGKHTSGHDPQLYQFDCEWFGGTKSARAFHQIYEQRPSEFSRALAHIPLEGEVSRQDYLAFVADYKAIFETDLDGNISEDSAPLMPATRLLMVWRPDTFVALNNAKAELLCLALGQSKLSKDDFEGYWTEVIDTLRSCAWLQSAEPEDDSELELWRNRAAFVDAFYFADKNTAQASNYLKLKDRKAGKANTAKSPRAGRKTKETAEQIVDRRLQDPELPAYFKERRDSLVSEVKKGKSVDQVIQLYRTIFG